MMRHDEALLWEYAARELPSEDARLVQHHLTECPDCQEKLTDVRTARGALEAVRGSEYRFEYAQTDAALAKAVEKKLTNAVFGRPWVLALSGGLVAAGLALVVYGMWTRAPSPPPAVAEVAAPLVKPQPAVEKAAGLSVIGAQPRVVGRGAALASGDVLRTDAKGDAMLRLPEGTRLKLGSSSQLSLTRAEADDVTLSLDRGHLAVAASHARRKGFVVHTGGLMVTVVGTMFSVTSSRDGVEVAVSEGRVSVEPPVGLPQLVNAGQRVRFDAKWRSVRSAITGAEKKELASLVEAQLPPPPPVPAPEPVRQAVVQPRASTVVAAAGGPSASAAELKSLVAGSVDDLAPLPQAAPPAPAPVPVASKPDMTGYEIPLLALPVESVGSAPPVFNEYPKPAVEEVTPSKASKLGGDDIAEDAESIFLRRADKSLNDGTCERYLVALDLLATDVRRDDRTQLARIMRARCFDSLMRVKEAEAEYHRYLREYPNGRHAAEARRVLSEL